jgi:rhamnogalacturonyl hydrolase YesR
MIYDSARPPLVSCARLLRHVAPGKRKQTTQFLLKIRDNLKARTSYKALNFVFYVFSRGLNRRSRERATSRQVQDALRGLLKRLEDEAAMPWAKKGAQQVVAQLKVFIEEEPYGEQPGVKLLMQSCNKRSLACRALAGVGLKHTRRA